MNIRIAQFALATAALGAQASAACKIGVGDSVICTTVTADT